MPDDAPNPAPGRAKPPTIGRTVVRHAEGATYDDGLRAFFSYRDLGIAEGSGGAYGANMIRAVPGTHAQPHWHWHELTFQMVLVLRGWVRFEYEDAGEVLLRPGDCVYQAPRVRHREIAHSDDLELVEITAPAEFETHIDE